MSEDEMKCPTCPATFEVLRGGMVQTTGSALYQLHLLEHIARAVDPDTVVLTARRAAEEAALVLRRIEEPHGD